MSDVKCEVPFDWSLIQMHCIEGPKGDRFIARHSRRLLFITPNFTSRRTWVSFLSRVWLGGLFHLSKQTLTWRDTMTMMFSISWNSSRRVQWTYRSKESLWPFPSSEKCSPEQSKTSLKSLVYKNVDKMTFFFNSFTSSLGVGYLMVCTENYPNVLAFSFLDELQREFIVTYDTKRINSALRPFSFIEFGEFRRWKKLETATNALTVIMITWNHHPQYLIFE